MSHDVAAFFLGKFREGEVVIELIEDSSHTTFAVAIDGADVAIPDHNCVGVMTDKTSQTEFLTGSKNGENNLAESGVERSRSHLTENLRVEQSFVVKRDFQTATEFADADIFKAASGAVEELVEHFDADKGNHTGNTDELINLIAENVNAIDFQEVVLVDEL